MRRVKLHKACEVVEMSTASSYNIYSVESNGLKSERGNGKEISSHISQGHLC